MAAPMQVRGAGRTPAHQGACQLKIRIHPHARARLEERGATEAEVFGTIEQGERFPAKFGRTGYRRNFAYGGTWRGKRYGSKQVEAYAVEDGDSWLVIPVIVKYFGEGGA
jgi:hypothetical protein